MVKQFTDYMENTIEKNTAESVQACKDKIFEGITP
jgi:hypothetical protein